MYVKRKTNVTALIEMHNGHRVFKIKHQLE